MTKTLHKHHIVPKHMGGTDDESNLVMLTVEEHAEAHRVLFEKYGKWEDEIAWKGLSGMLTNEECIQRKLVEAGRKGGRYNVESGRLQRISSAASKARFEQNKDEIVATLRANAQRAKGKKGREYGGARRKWMWVHDGTSNKKVLAEGGVPDGYIRGRLM